MKKQASVKMNFVMNFILTISNLIFPLVTFPYVSRVIGVEGLGIVQFATSNVSYFVMFAMLGIPTYGIRACARVRNNEEQLAHTTLEIMLVNLISASIAIGLFIIMLMIVPTFREEKILYLILATQIVFNVIGVDWLYRATEQYTYITIRSIVIKFMSAGLMFGLIHSQDDYVVYGLITVLAGVGSNIWNFMNLRKVVQIKMIKKETLNLKRHIRPILNFFLLSISAQIYLNMNTTLLGFMDGNEAVGYYTAGLKIKNLLVSVVTALGAVLLPRLSFYYENHHHEQFNQLSTKALRFIMLLSLSVTLYFTIMAEEGIVFLSGTEYLPAVLLTQLSMPSVVFIALSNLMGIQMLVPMNKEILVVYSTAAGAVVDLLVNAVAIPALSGAGAALAATAAELAVVLVQVYVLRQLIIPMVKQVEFGKIGIALVFAGMSVIGLKMYLSWPVFVMLGFTGVVFYVVFVLILFITKETIVTESVNIMTKKLSRS